MPGAVRRLSIRSTERVVTPSSTPITPQQEFRMRNLSNWKHAVIGMALMIVTAGCDRGPSATGGAAPAATAVKIVHPEKKAINRVIEQPGAIMPSEETRLFAKLPGFVKTIGLDPQKNAAGATDGRVD